MKKKLTVLLTALPLALAGVSADAAIMINEVESDTFNTPATDYGEFIELYSTTGTTTSLTGLTLVLINGNGNVSYAALDLDGLVTDSNGYYLFGTTSTSGVPGADNTSLLGAGNFLQNGQDAVALYSGDATSYANGTAASTVNLLDAVVYGTDDADDTDLLTALNETVQFNEGPNPASDSANVSLSRFANGSGEFVQSTPTPGSANVPEPTSLAVSVVACGLLLSRRRAVRV